MSAVQALALALTLGWLLLAWLLPVLRLHQRGSATTFLIMTGVPLLGWLTLHWGPLVGVAGFALGLLVLTRQSRRRRIVARQD